MSAGWFTARPEGPPRQAQPASRRRWLPVVAYRRRGAQPLADHEEGRGGLSSLIGSRSGTLAGLLVHDRARLLQWLGGPVEGLRRVWRSLQRTPVRRESAGRTPAPVDAPAPVSIAATALWVESTIDRQAELRPTLAALIDQAVIPRLSVAHAPVRAHGADRHAGDLALLLIAKEASAAFELIDRRRAAGGSIETLCSELFEPAARTMGDLWRTDECSEFDVTLGLGRLQMALHRCSADNAASARPGSAGRAVLLAPSPHEPHLLGSAVAVELFWRAGWDVSCDFPVSAEALSRRLHEHWFDVLDLSLSSAFTREHRLEELAATIRAARAGSLNPQLAVIVDGRLFHDQPRAWAAVGADASCSCALELLPVAERRLSGSSLH